MATDPPDYNPAIDLHPDLLVPARGETVAATRYEPADREGPLPVILIATPYRKDDRIAFGSWDPSIQYFATHGYEVVLMDLLGTGASTGTREPFDGREGEEVAAVVDWLAERDWTTGSVGTFGLSYGAWTQYLAAAEGPEALDAIVPVAVTPSVYESSWTGGTFNLLKRATWPARMQASRALPPSRRDDGGRWADVWRERLDELRDGRPWLFQFLDHPTEDGFWRDRTVDPGAIDVPTFAACGYRDVHTRPMVEFFEEIPAPKRMLLGPWRHTMPERGREVAVDFRRQALAWYDRFLKGEDDDAVPGPTVTYWTEREGGWTPGAGVWRPAEAWPTAASGGTVRLALAPEGLVRAADLSGSVARDYEYDHTVGAESLDRVGGIVNPGTDTGGDDARSLSVETEPLGDPVELTGTAAATIRMRATTSDPIVAVRLVDVGPTGSARLVAAGYLRASHRNGHADPEEIVPGEEYEVTVPLSPKSHVFEAGRRIRVAVAAAYFPRTMPTGDHGSFTVLSDPAAPSGVTLPGRVHEGGVAFDETREMSAPDDAEIPVSPAFVTRSSDDWEVARGPLRDSVAFRTEQASAIELPHGPEMTSETRIEAEALRDDPASTYLRHETTLGLAYPNEDVRVHTTARTGTDVQSIATTVSVDDRVVFEEDWIR